MRNKYLNLKTRVLSRWYQVERLRLPSRSIPYYLVSKTEVSEPIVVEVDKVVERGSEIVSELVDPTEIKGGLGLFLVFEWYAQNSC